MKQGQFSQEQIVAILHQAKRGETTVQANYREDVTAQAGVSGSGWSTSAAWIDYDNDGCLDLFVCHYCKGTVEGRINRLKLLKRSMYGRAGVPLLRKRILCAC